MKKLVGIFMSLILVFTFCGIAGAEENNGAIIDLGESEIFTNADLETAVEAILSEFSTWEGTEMHLITYAGDVQSQAELEYVQKYYEEGYDEVAVFLSAFRSPKEAYGAWQEDKEYTYSWCTARKDKGKWNLINWGWAENFFKTEKYSEEDMRTAMNTIYASLQEMEGTEFHFMRYSGDDFSNNQLEYVNSLERGVFDECAVFNVWFQSPKEAYGAWEPDRLYTWDFFLARADKGEWQIVTFGY